MALKEYTSLICTQAITQQLKDTNYQTLLDYGGGTGLVTLNIAEYFETVTLMDASPNGRYF